jgi:hypothetical protein
MMMMMMMMITMIHLLLQLQQNYIYIRVGSPTMDQFSIIDNNKGMCYVETKNKYCFKFLDLCSIAKPNFANVTHRKLLEKNY